MTVPGVEVVEATPDEWALIQQRLDAEDAEHALEHQDHILARYRNTAGRHALRDGAPRRKVSDDHGDG